MAGFGKTFENNKKRIKKNINIPLEKIINQAFSLHSHGKIREAEKYYKYCIDQKIIDYRIFSNYGLILKNKGEYSEAEIYLKQLKLIQIGLRGIIILEQYRKILEN